jgi:hypothetical protein
MDWLLNMKSRWEQYKEKHGVTPLDLLNPQTKYVESTMHIDRMNICKSCPELIKLTSQCKKCGCFMEIKTKLEAAKCPIGKW